MGGVQSATVNMSSLQSGPCKDSVALVQQELIKAPEFNGKFYVHLNTLEQVDISGQTTRCKAGLFLTDVNTGFTKQENRVVTLLTANNATTVQAIGPDVATSTTNTAPYFSPAEIRKYYEDLHSYNAGWTAFRWKTVDNYEPPMPKWGDPIFTSSVKIYNNLFRNVLRKTSTTPLDLQAMESASGSVPGYTVVNSFYQKYLSPLPADPVPPSPRILTVPVMNVATAGGSGSGPSASVVTAAAVNNMQAQANNLEKYNIYVGPSSPDYDPPQLGDNYETVLTKYNKSYDIAVSNINLNGMQTAGSGIPELNRRLARRIDGKGQMYYVPDAVLPETGIPKSDRYKTYNFNERQQYLIDYSPVTGPDRDLLVKNFCNSLGYEEYRDGLAGCSPGDCCAPMSSAPQYNKEEAAIERAARLSASASSIEPFTASASANSKCGTGFSLTGRTTTISVPRPPITLDPTQAMFVYRTTRPTDSPASKCASSKPADPIIDTSAIQDLYKQLRPSLIKELQQNLKGNKLFELRCPASAAAAAAEQ
jgi:hypothetical protein